MSDCHDQCGTLESPENLNYKLNPFAYQVYQWLSHCCVHIRLVSYPKKEHLPVLVCDPESVTPGQWRGQCCPLSAVPRHRRQTQPHGYSGESQISSKLVGPIVVQWWSQVVASNVWNMSMSKLKEFPGFQLNKPSFLFFLIFYPYVSVRLFLLERVQL